MTRKIPASGAAVLAGLSLAAPAEAAVSAEVAYVFNSFSFLVCGALVMFMAAGFAMLESGLVRAKNTAAICLKNIALYSIAGLMFYLIGYDLMYTGVDGGAIGGLVAITAGPDLQNHLLAIVVGGIGGALVVFAVPLLDKLRIDDVVGAISAHLVAGIWGTLAVGIFGSGDFVVQLIGVLAVGAFVTIASAIVWFAIRAVIGLRIDEEAERLGLDQVELGIEAYAEFGTGSQSI